MIKRRIQIHSWIFTIICILVVLLFLLNPQLGLLIENIGKEGGLLSLFVAGAFYTISFTAPAATAAVFYLGKVFTPLSIAAIGAFGSLCTDYLIYKFIRKKVSQSAHYFAQKLKLKIKFKKQLNFIAQILSILIIASPLPDELGVAILSVAKIKQNMFFVYSYVGNFIGILIVSYLGAVL
ncbi:MAG: hypothetical protein QW063_02240 [Candidatus Nanoarchaeia archaeon]